MKLREFIQAFVDWMKHKNKLHYIGRRGGFLLLFGIAFLVIGYTAYAFPIRHIGLARFPHEHLSPWLRFGLWCLAAAVAIICAFRRKPGEDVPGFVALCIPVAERVVSYAIGFGLSIFNPIYDGLFRPGISGVLIYTIMLCTIMLIASWPEPREEIIKPLLFGGKPGD